VTGLQRFFPEEVVRASPTTRRQERGRPEFSRSPNVRQRPLLARIAVVHGVGSLPPSGCQRKPIDCVSTVVRGKGRISHANKSFGKTGVWSIII